MGLVAIVAIVIFSGCIERGEATPSTLTTPTPKQIEASDGQVTIILDKIERADVMPLDIVEARRVAYRKVPTPIEGCDFVCVYLTIARIENVHLVPPVDYVLVDAEGHEYEPIDYVVQTRIINPENLAEASFEFAEGENFIIFEVPNHEKPAKLSFVYSFKETLEENSAKKSQIEIYFQATSTPTPTPIPSSPTTTKISTPEEKGVHGFEAAFAIAGLLAVVYLVRRRK